MDFPDVFAERLETYRSLIFRKDKIYTHPKVVATAQNEHDLLDILFQHTAARRRLPTNLILTQAAGLVSTHSRAEAAATRHCNKTDKSPFQHTAARRRLQAINGGRTAIAGFNTQPPEGGCQQGVLHLNQRLQFQHTAARRRLRRIYAQPTRGRDVSTHSRPKAAA